MLPHGLFSACILAFSFFGLTSAQYGFEIPYPNYSDFDDINTVKQNSVLNFVWRVNTTYQPTVNGEKLLDSNNNISLWLTSFQSRNYTKCLAASINSANGGSFSFTVDISDEDIDVNNGKFVLRLKPTVGSISSTYNPTYRECPSRGFLIEKAVASSSTTVSSSSTASSSATASASVTETGSTSASATASSTQTASLSSSSTSTSDSDDDNGGLTTGAKVGVGIGAVAGVLLLLLLGFVLYRRRDQQQQEQQQQAELSGAPPNGMAYYQGPPGGQGYPVQNQSPYSNGPTGYPAQSPHQNAYYKDQNGQLFPAIAPINQTPVEMYGDSRSELPTSEVNSPVNRPPSAQQPSPQQIVR